VSSHTGEDEDESNFGQNVGAVSQFAQSDRRKVQNVTVGFFGVWTKIRTKEI
jgi:hypothetical protein